MNKPDLTAYYTACRKCADDPQAFATFRSNGQIRAVTDTNTLEHGLECERWIMQHGRFLLPWLDTFRRIDSVGMPPLYQFKHVGLFNPTTLRHIVTLGRIKPLLAGIYPRTIVEIGSSYGALAALFQLFDWRVEYQYFYENAAVVMLATAYMQSLSIQCPINIIPDSSGDPYYASSDGAYSDLVISCYAFSELDRETQDWYLEHVIEKAQAGFLVMNTCAGGYTRQELAERLNAQVLPEIPATHKDNYTLTWRRD